MVRGKEEGPCSTFTILSTDESSKEGHSHALELPPKEIQSSFPSKSKLEQGLALSNVGGEHVVSEGWNLADV